MTVPILTNPEIFFGILVLAGFAAFVVSLAGVQLYTLLAPARVRRATAPRPVASRRVSGHAVST